MNSIIKVPCIIIITHSAETFYIFLKKQQANQLPEQWIDTVASTEE